MPAALRSTVKENRHAASHPLDRHPDPAAIAARREQRQPPLFVATASADGAAEVELGQLALQTSSSAGVKQMAQRIIDDHTRANRELAGLAGRKQLTPASHPDAAAQATARRLQALDGVAFDRAYAGEMVKDRADLHRQRQPRPQALRRRHPAGAQAPPADGPCAGRQRARRDGAGGTLRAARHTRQRQRPAHGR
ncbi:DUF4142 domain-containing protein [Frateuria defendens]|uniref:DUF4142 domain-containing protein n=1 Tax=Frateuria defendens TaxID=2219559 RepID=UPI0009E47BAE|nr:DUF4142 domain-containing protein [Frateuria defendens]